MIPPKKDSTGQIDSDDLNSFIGQSAEMDDKLQPHITRKNIADIYCNILLTLFLPCSKYIALGIATAYAIKLLKCDIIQKLVNLVVEQKESINMLIICITIISLYFIKHKWGEKH